MPEVSKVKQRARREQGASQAKTHLRGRLRSYFSHHSSTARDSLNRLMATPYATAMTWFVIGIALALPVGLSLILSNAESASDGWDSGAQVSVFLHKRIQEQDGRGLATRLAQRADVVSTRYISAEQALEEFQQLSGFGNVLRNLDSNPLPALIIVIPASSVGMVATEALVADLQAITEVQNVVLDLAWVQRLYSLMEISRRVVLALGLMLALGVLLVIGNTIRLAIESRRDEVVIIKLVGGSDAFVRRPFLYTGFWYGAGGALIAWLLIGLALIWVSGPLASLSALYQSSFSIHGLGFAGGVLLLLAGGCLGLFGAWLAVARHLAEIQPR
jgi:cell division transport system permease protein